MTLTATWTGSTGTPIASILAMANEDADSLAHITWIASLDEVTAPQMLAQFHARVARPLGPYRSRVDVIDCSAGNGRVILRLRWHAEGVARETLRRALTARARDLPGSLNFTVASAAS